MMKYFLTLLFVSFFAIISYGQLPDGSIAPDFTVTDINGEEHNLYEKLDEGKTVILDIYATWCSPCWNFHSSHVLTDIWNELGPDGTDEVFIIAIEGDLDTNSDDLYGAGSNTKGNWVEGTPYPIVDETEGQGGLGTIASDYMVVAFPAVYFICPDRSVSKIGWQSVVSEYSSLVDSCFRYQGENNLRITAYSGVEGTICEAVDFTPSISFQNLGNQTATSATFDFTINGTTEQFNWEGNLPTFQFAELDFSNVTAFSTDILIEIVDVNSQSDNYPDNNTLETSILTPLITEIDTVTIEIMTDTYGAETYWAVLNDSDEIIAEGGNLAVGLNVTIDSLVTTEAPTHPNAYSENTLYTSDNPFAHSEFVSTETVFINEIKTIPNPVVNDLTIEIPDNSTSVRSINIFDIQGKVIFNTTTVNTSNHQIKLDLSDFHSGIYILEVRFEDGTATQRKIFKR